jgi:hypothetical protein
MTGDSNLPIHVFVSNGIPGTQHLELRGALGDFYGLVSDRIPARNRLIPRARMKVLTLHANSQGLLVQ